MTVFKRWWDGIRLHWASELVYEAYPPGQHMRYLGTVEARWTLFDLTMGGRPSADEQLQNPAAEGDELSSATAREVLLCAQ